MKTLNFPSIVVLMIVACSLTFSSCRKREKEDTDDEQATVADNNMAENIANDIDLMGSQVSENSSLTTFRTGGNTAVSGADLKMAAVCATVTGIGTKIIVVDFGIGCVGLDGRTRSGQLTFNFSASNPATAVFYRNPGFSMTVSSQNYVVDGNEVNITNKTVTNTTPLNIPDGPNPGTNLTWAINANVSILKAGAANPISWTCNRTKELLNTNVASCYNGQANPINWKQAEIKLNGNTVGVNAKGENFSATATNLVKHFSCAPDPNRPHRHPFISGTISYIPGSRQPRLVDFGNMSCDLNATVTVKKKTFNITL